MDGVMALAQKHRLWVIEDAACGFGARFGDRHAGTFGDAGCFSFHPRKSITTGEGGMLTTQREELDQLVRCLRDHGASRTDLARHQASQAFLLADYDHLGFNYRMTDLQGALGCAQMGRAADVLQQRAQRARRYDRLLSDLDWLATPRVPAAFVHGYQAYVCLFQPEKATLANVERLHTERNTLMGRLEQHGVATRQGTHAPVLLGYYRDKYHLRPGDFPRAYIADRLSLALPLFPQMTDVEQDLVVQCLREAVHEERVA
jgi:dTDP-4-amino-4,6-dideoxygalactose transaminase